VKSFKPIITKDEWTNKPSESFEIVFVDMMRKIIGSFNSFFLSRVLERVCKRFLAIIKAYKDSEDSSMLLYYKFSMELRDKGLINKKDMNSKSFLLIRAGQYPLLKDIIALYKPLVIILVGLERASYDIKHSWIKHLQERAELTDVAVKKDRIQAHG
jgi:hypothetical protein